MEPPSASTALPEVVECRTVPRGIAADFDALIGRCAEQVNCHTVFLDDPSEWNAKSVHWDLGH